MAAPIDPDSEVTVDNGATQAIFTTIQALAHTVTRSSSRARVRQLHSGDPPRGCDARSAAAHGPGYDVDSAGGAGAISPRTRMILVKPPNNPGTGVLSEADLSRFAEITMGTDIVIVSDEVYDTMVYDARHQRSLARNDELAARSASLIGSFSADVSRHPADQGRLRAGATGDHRGIRRGIRVHRVHGHRAWNMAWRNSCRSVAIGHCRRIFTAKRDLLRAALAGTPLDLLPCRGSYFSSRRTRASARNPRPSSHSGWCASMASRPSAVGLLPERYRSPGDPFLLRQARRDDLRCGRTAARTARVRLGVLAELSLFGSRVHSSPMRRPVLYAVLSFLLLVTQGQALVHPFAHLDPRAARPDRVEAALPHAVVACAECALLAAGSDTVHRDAPASQLVSEQSEAR